MADLKSFLNQDTLSALRDKGLISDDTYASAINQTSPVTDQAPIVDTQNMSVDPNAAAPVAPPQAPKEPEINTGFHSAPPQDTSYMGGTGSPDSNPYLDPIKQAAHKAAESGDVDAASEAAKKLEMAQGVADKANMSSQMETQQKYQQQLQKVTDYNARAEKLGLPKLPEPKPEQFGVAAEKAPATPADVDSEMTPTKEEVAQAAQPFRAQAAQQDAAQQTQDNVQKRAIAADVNTKANMDSATQKVASDLDDSGTKNQAMKAFAILLGGIGQGFKGGENEGLKAVQRFEDQQIAKHRYDDTQKLALRKMLIDEAEMQIKKSTAQSDSVYKQAEAQKALAEVGKLKNQVGMNQLFASRAATGQGFTPQEAYMMEDKVREKMVGGFKDGMLRPALGDAKKLQEEIMPAAKASLDGLQKLRDINRSYMSGKLDITGARQQAKVLSQSLIGNLRVEMFGPGRFTDREQQIMTQIVKDPTAIFSLPQASETALRTLSEKVKYGTREKLKSAGVQIPDSANDRRLQEVKNYFKSKGKAISDGDAQTYLIEKGHWDDQDDLL